MTNKERQKQLDKQKWMASEAKTSDQSGNMDYCKHCDRNSCGNCSATQDERRGLCICARAYNRMVRRKANAKMH
jgi:hypothetical protein